MLLICFSALTFLYMIHWIGLLFGFKQFNHFGRICSESWFWIVLITGNCILQTYWLSVDPTHESDFLWLSFAGFAFIMACIIYVPVSKAVMKFHNNQKIKRGNNE